MRLPWRRAQNSLKRPAPVFSPGQVHQPRTRLFRLFEIFLVVAVLGGTSAVFVHYKGAQMASFFRKLPAVLAPKEVTKKVSVDVPFDEKLKQELLNGGIKFDSIQKTSEGNYLVSASGVSIFFDVSKDPASQVSTLQTLLAKAKIDGKQVKKVDFRFENLIVEF